MELFRSEEMQLVQLIIPAEAAHDTVYHLGEVGLLQFKDLNSDKSAFQRTYANQVKRCDEMLRQLRFFSDMIGKAGLTAVPRLRDKELEIDELEMKLVDLERELLESNANVEKLRRSQNELVELQLVLEKAGGFFDAARAGAGLARDYDRPDSSGNLEGAEAGAPMAGGKASVRLGFVTGVVPSERAEAFERVLFRTTRGNMFLKQSPIEGKVEDPASGEKVLKTVFVIFFAGERARQKILKICEAFAANRYPFPEEFARQRAMNAEVTARLRELHTTLEASSQHRDSTLTQIGYSLEAWTTMVRREKAVYHTLNLFSIDVTRKCLVAEGWCPNIARQRIQAALVEAARVSSAQVGTIFQPLPTKEMPPTFFATNKITEAFVDIVEAYGVASYREANPAVFTIVTFPFLFAVMFGDFGHALLMLMFSGYMVIKEKQLLTQDLGEIVGMAFGGRYVILLMSFFSLYTGLLYNEFFSVPMTLFGGSKFVCPSDPNMNLDECPEASKTGLVPTGTYPFGADPIWHGTRSELPFFNSMKMKMSILFGVCHMMLGIMVSAANHLHFGDMLSIYAEFIPQVLFLGSIFGYLSMLIIIKWSTPGCTTDLYHVMIYMFLAPGNVNCQDPPNEITGDLPKPGCPENVILASASSQGGFQNFLVLIAFVAVPWMLIPKPYYIKKRHEEKEKRAAFGHTEDEEGHGGGHGHGHGGHFDFGEIVVHQMIHTIEFVLGAISNTASYLRLWALSLAHAQLSAVFYEKVLMMGVSTGSPIALTIAFFVWAMATMGVLMIMETLSAFLHALRLHWVEFMNKFYKADGYRFEPLNFTELLTRKESGRD